MADTQLNISYHSITDKGGRAVNEDSLGILPTKDALYFLLCDGLGGHGSGDIASSFVVEQMKANLEKGISVEESITRTQQALLEKQKKEDATDKMKTTLTCLTISNLDASFAHVGDSRIYYFEKGKYMVRTQDHSVPQMLYQSGEIKEKDIRHHVDRSRLLRVMGTEWSSPKYQITKGMHISQNSTFILCSDGFWELIDEKMMCKLLKKSATPEEWLESMREVVLQNGKGTNMDNYSAIAVFVR